MILLKKNPEIPVMGSSPSREEMVLVCKYLVCHLAASCILNPKPVIAKLLAAAVETGRTKGELQVHLGTAHVLNGASAA